MKNIHEGKRAINGLNHGMPYYVKSLAIGPLRQKTRPEAWVFVCLSPSGHVFNITWQAMIKHTLMPRVT